jgi:hypothetical protein
MVNNSIRRDTMSRVVPSQVVGLIDKLFPRVKEETEGNAIAINAGHAVQLMSIIVLTDHVPCD